MSQIGRYVGGYPFVVLPPGGVRVTATTPASAVIEGDKRHGLAVITELGPFSSGAGPSTQGYDARTDNFGGNGPLPYVDALNKDPGNTGVALTVTAPQVIIKAVSKTDAEVASQRQFLKARYPAYFVAMAPAADSLPPPIGAPALVSDMVKTDINFALWPNLAQVAGGTAATVLLNAWRWLTIHEQFTVRPRSDYYTGGNYEQFYASAQAILGGEACLACCFNIDPTTKENLTIQTVIKARNICEVLDAGGRYNTNSGLGGILAGAKLPVVVAAALTGHAKLVSWANRTDWAAEDRQVRYVTQSLIDTYDFIQDDLNMPDWDHNPVSDPAKNTRLMTDTYETIFWRHIIPQVMCAMLLPGGKSAWNYNALFDYVDRMMERTLYRDVGSQNQWARTLTSTNAPSAYQKLVWDTYRSSVGMPAIWNW